MVIDFGEELKKTGNQVKIVAFIGNSKNVSRIYTSTLHYRPNICSSTFLFVNTTLNEKRLKLCPIPNKYCKDSAYDQPISKHVKQRENFSQQKVNSHMNFHKNF